MAPSWRSCLLLGCGGGAIVTGANTLPPFITSATLTTGGVFNLLNLFFGLGGLVTPLIAANLFQNQSGRLLIFAGSLAVFTLAVHAITPMPARCRTGRLPGLHRYGPAGQARPHSPSLSCSSFMWLVKSACGTGWPAT